MEENKKQLRIIGVIYGTLISIINYLGFLIPSTGKFPIRETEDFLIYRAFMKEYPVPVTILGVSAFVIPVIFCVLYSWVCKTEDLKRRIINIPLVYSFFGSIGWILSFFFDFFFLCATKFFRGIQIKDIVFSSSMNILNESLFIFTLGFLILYTINRKYVLPKIFPEENIMLIKGILKPSVQFLFIVFYISVGLFPIFYLISCLVKESIERGFDIQNSVYIVVAFLITCGIVISITLSNFFDFPLKKLKEGTEKIKEGNYSDKVKVVSNDSFGELTYTFNEMASSLDEKTKRIMAIQESVIRGMAVMVESRDNSTGGHINRTSDCVKVFVEKLRQAEQYKNLSDSFCKAVIKAAPMHDLGKIAVDDAILRKPGKFTDEEYSIMQKHSAEGARIVENVVRDVDDEEFKTIAVNVAHYHHEKWNGTGYPEKISGEQIPFEARIMALADVFDALVSKRCYKDSFSYDRAFSIIEDSLGTHFDPVLGKIFISCRPELQALYEGYNS